MHNKATLRLVSTNPDCVNCAVWSLCCGDCSRKNCAKTTKGVLKEMGPLSSGQIIYRNGDAFRSIYIVQSGVVKTETETIDGRVNVTGIYTRGDLFGLEGIGSSSFPGRAVAIHETAVCDISYTGLLKLCASNPKLHSEFLSRLGKRIQSDEYNWKTIMKEPASRRLLFFLSHFHHRQSQTVADWNNVELPISKQDIANFLGLSAESLSRALKTLETDGSIIQVSSSSISISRQALREKY